MHAARAASGRRAPHERAACDPSAARGAALVLAHAWARTGPLPAALDAEQAGTPLSVHLPWQPLVKRGSAGRLEDADRSKENTGARTMPGSYFSTDLGRPCQRIGPDPPKSRKSRFGRRYLSSGPMRQCCLPIFARVLQVRAHFGQAWTNFGLLWPNTSAKFGPRLTFDLANLGRKKNELGPNLTEHRHIVTIMWPEQIGEFEQQTSSSVPTWPPLPQLTEFGPDVGSCSNFEQRVSNAWAVLGQVDFTRTIVGNFQETMRSSYPTIFEELSSAKIGLSRPPGITTQQSRLRIAQPFWPKARRLSRALRFVFAPGLPQP